MKKITSRKPKIKIISNGRVTKVWINGKLINRATIAELHFYAEPFSVDFEYEKYKQDKNGKLIVNGDKIETERHELKYGEV